MSGLHRGLFRLMHAPADEPPRGGQKQSAEPGEAKKNQ